jgi:hypothetical protein
MRVRLLTFFVAVAAIVGTSLTSAATAGAATAAPASASTNAAAGGVFIHEYLYRTANGTYYVFDHPESAFGAQVGGFELTNAGELILCDDKSDRVYIGGELSVNGNTHLYLDPNNSQPGCYHKTLSLTRGDWVKMTIYTGPTAHPNTPRGGIGAAW